MSGWPEESNETSIDVDCPPPIVLLVGLVRWNREAPTPVILVVETCAETCCTNWPCDFYSANMLNLPTFSVRLIRLNGCR